MNFSRVDSFWVLSCCKMFLVFVIKITGIRSCFWEFSSLRNVFRAAGIILWFRISILSMFNRNLKVGGFCIGEKRSSIV